MTLHPENSKSPTPTEPEENLLARVHKLELNVLHREQELADADRQRREELEDAERHRRHDLKLAIIPAVITVLGLVVGWFGTHRSLANDKEDLASENDELQSENQTLQSEKVDIINSLSKNPLCSEASGPLMDAVMSCMEATERNHKRKKRLDEGIVEQQKSDLETCHDELSKCHVPE